MPLNLTVRHGFRLLGLGIGLAVASHGYGFAQEFPSKTIEVVIHSKYGGGTDTTARMMMIRSRRILDTDMPSFRSVVVPASERMPTCFPNRRTGIR